MSVVNVRGINVAYEEAGDGEAFVLLHGYPLNRSMWRGQVEELRERCRIITPDLRGLGETETGNEEAATMEAMAEDVAALMDTLKIERAIVGGLSMGGYVSLAFYRLFPERMRALVLADTRATPDTEETQRGREESARKALREGMTTIADALLPKVLAPRTMREQPEVVSAVHTMMTTTKPEGAAAALRGMAARRDQTDLLPQIKAPVLVIVGDVDTVTPPEEAEAMRQAIPNASLSIIEGAGHISNMEEPAQFNRALVSFLKGLED